MKKFVLVSLLAIIVSPVLGETFVPIERECVDLERAIQSLTNQYGQAVYERPKTYGDARLSAAAMQHAIDMIVEDFYDHTNHEDRVPWQRAVDFGYPAEQGSVGEALAISHAPELEDLKTVEEVALSWYTSTNGHSEIVYGTDLANSLTSDIGIAVYTHTNEYIKWPGTPWESVEQTYSRTFVMMTAIPPGVFAAANGGGSSSTESIVVRTERVSDGLDVVFYGTLPNRNYPITTLEMVKGVAIWPTIGYIEDDSTGTIRLSFRDLSLSFGSFGTTKRNY